MSNHKTLPPRRLSAGGNHVDVNSTSFANHRSSSRSQTYYDASEEVVLGESREPRNSSPRDYSSRRSRSTSRGPTRGHNSERARSSSRNRLPSEHSTSRGRSSSSRHIGSSGYEPSRRSKSQTGQNSRARSTDRQSSSSRQRSLSRSSYEPRHTNRIGREEARSGVIYMEDHFKPRCRSKSSSRPRHRSKSSNSRRESRHPSLNNAVIVIPTAIQSDLNESTAKQLSHPTRSSGRKQNISYRETATTRDDAEDLSERLRAEAPPERNPDYASFASVSANGTTAAQRNLDVMESASETEEVGTDRYASVVATPNGVATPAAGSNSNGYDFTPLGKSLVAPEPPSPSPIDPWASPNVAPFGGGTDSTDDDDSEMMDSKHDDEEHGSAPSGETALETFLAGSEIHPNMVQSEEDIAQLRLFAGKLSADWGGEKLMAPALARRIRDFQYAQEKRRRKYGDERPWGILGLYDHLSGIRVDVEWAEDAAWRRSNGEPYLSWADFEASKKKGINRPFFTYFILFVCTITTIVSIGLNGWKVEPFDQNPMIGPSAETLIRMGAKSSYLIVHQYESWRLVSSIILHAGLIHYFVNMLALWFVGAAIETSHGFIATTIVFTVPAVGGTILSALFLPDHITVGASGGIFGLIGACLADILSNWKLLFNNFVTENGKKHNHILVLVFLVLDIILNSIIGLTPYVDNFTHLGGMVYGFLCGISTMERVSSDFFGMAEGILKRTKHIVVRFFGLIVSLIAIVITLIVLLEGDGATTPCPDCTWLSCVPFPPWAADKDKWWYCDDCGLVTAEIVSEPELHLDLQCPGGTSVDVPLDEDDRSRKQKLEKKLPDYCREFCSDDETRFRF